jgi:hypothetical protein
VEPPDAAALLDPAIVVGEESEPTDSMMVFIVVALCSVVFIMAASVATFAMASSAAFIAATLSAATFSDAALSVAAFTAVALSASTFAIIASSINFATVASFVVLISTTFLVIVTAVEADQLPLDLSGAIDAATLGSGYGADMCYNTALTARRRVTTILHRAAARSRAWWAEAKIRQDGATLGYDLTG